MAIEYDQLSLSELKEIHKRSAAAIESFEERRQKEAMARVLEVLKEEGYSSLDELTKGKKSKRASPAPAKYRNPDNIRQTWSGLGRKPSWVLEYEETGTTLEELAIK